MGFIRQVTSYSVIIVPRTRGYVYHYLMFSNEKKPELVGRTMWDSPHVCAQNIRDTGNYEELPGLNGGLMYMKFNP